MDRRSNQGIRGGRPQDIAPEGYRGTREAAERLGLTAQAVRNRIRAGRLEGIVKETSIGEKRYYVAESALGVFQPKGTDEIVRELPERVAALESQLAQIKRRDQLLADVLRQVLALLDQHEEPQLAAEGDDGI
jgi:DNA-binding Lrp family transcriptional regulator